MKTKRNSFRLLALAGVVALAGLSSAHAQNLFVANGGNNTIGDYNITTGTGVTVPFAPAGVSGPIGVALSGNTLYVGNQWHRPAQLLQRDHRRLAGQLLGPKRLQHRSLAAATSTSTISTLAR